MKQILYIIPFCPMPTNSGGKVRILNTIKALSKNNQLTILAFYQNENEKTESIKFFDSLKIKYSFFKINPKKSIFSPIPFWFSNWHSATFLKYLKNLNFSQFNDVIIETTQLLYIIDYIPKNAKTIFVAENISTISYWRRLLEVNLIKKIMHLYRLGQVYLYEKKYLNQYEKIIVMSQYDQTILNKLFNINDSIISQNGMAKINFINKKISSSPTLGYLGSATHSPNIKAINFITNIIAPNVTNKIVIVGSDNSYLDKHQDNVQFVDFIPNLADFYQQVDILVAPIFSGSGSRIKIIESLSFGIPVITTRVGAEGIDIVSPYLSIINDINNAQLWKNEIDNIFQKITSKDTTKLSKQLEKYLWTNTQKPLSQLL